MRFTRGWPAVLVALALAGCAAGPQAPPPPLLVFGEQHDQPDEQRQVADEVQRLARRGQLAALVLEMAERGRSTAGLPRDADEAAARQALAWGGGWPWEPYAAMVMNAVRAGVPVWGGNLPRAQMRGAMADAGLEAQASAEVRAGLADAVREGHCGLLPETQVPGMVRVQLARDLSMAATVQQALAAARPGQTVILHVGAQHAARDRGVPWHLLQQRVLAGTQMRVVAFGDAARNAGLAIDEVRPAAFTPRADPCEGLAKTLEKRRAGAASAPAP